MPWPASQFDKVSNTVCAIHAVNYDFATRGASINNHLDRQRRPGLSDTAHVVGEDEHYMHLDGSSNFTSMAAGALASYRFVVESSNTFYFWINMRHQSNSPDVYWGVDNVQLGTASTGTQSSDVWVSLGSTVISTPGRHALNIGPRRDGTLWRQVLVTTDSAYTPSGFVSISGFRDSGNPSDDHRCSGDWVDWAGHHDFQNSPITTSSGIFLANGYDGFS